MGSWMQFHCIHRKGAIELRPYRRASSCANDPFNTSYAASR